MLGNEKQEMKIAMMGTVANQMFSRHDAKVYKGCFRQGFVKTMQDHAVREWSSVAALPAAKRERFFREALENSRKQLLVIGLSDAEIGNLFNKLMQENKAFLAN
jgi:hypothetical protein